MSDDKGKVTDKAGEIAKNIWLAGIGAYGKAVEDAQGMLGKAKEQPKLFRELVKAGAALEEEARGALQSTAAARHSVEERINRVRENFQMQRPARHEDIVALEKKLDALTRKVAALARALEGMGGAAATTRKPLKKPVKAAKKAPAKAAAKTTGKNSRKTAPKKAARKQAAAKPQAAAGKSTPASKRQR